MTVAYVEVLLLMQFFGRVHSILSRYFLLTFSILVRGKIENFWKLISLFYSYQGMKNTS